jgi:uncharacterized Zn finger protein
VETVARQTGDVEEVLPVYQQQVDTTLGWKNDGAYRAAISLLRKVRALLARLGREAEFGAYVQTVRAAHKPKRNFLKLLGRAKWR